MTDLSATGGPVDVGGVTFEVPDLTTDDSVPDDEAAAELDLGLDLTAEEQDFYNQASQRYEEIGWGDSPDSDPQPPDGSEGGEGDGQGDAEVPPAAVPPPPPPAEPPPPPPPDTFARVPETERESLANLYTYLAQNPDVRDALAAAVEAKASGRQLAPPAPEPPAPEWLEAVKDDPAVYGLYQMTRQTQTDLAQMRRDNEARLAQDRQARLNAEIHAGMTSFATSHPELSNQDIEAIRLNAITLGITDGLARSMPGPQAVVKAMELSMSDLPQFKPSPSSSAPSTPPPPPAAKRRRALGSLAGSSGSASREPAPPTAAASHEEMVQGMAEWLKEQNILGNNL